MIRRLSILAQVKKLWAGIRTSPQSIVLLLALLLSIGFFRWGILVDSALSLLLGLASLVVHPLEAWDYFRPECVKYWLAIATWCFSIFIAVRSLSPRKKNPVATRGFFVPGQKATREGHTSSVVLAGFGILSLLGPIVTPVNPDEQGELATTRFATPLSTATCWSFVPEYEANGKAPDFLLDALEQTNHRMLHKKTIFTRGSEIPAGIAQSARSYSIILIFGTDELARDIFSRVIEGAKISLGIGLLVAIASVCLGALLGFLSGLFGRPVDPIIMRLIDIVLAIPPLFLIIAMLSFLGGSVWIMILVLTLTGWMGVARLVRAEILKLRESEYVLTARMVGASRFGIIRSHLLPNVFPTILTASILQLVNAILGESALSFLGLGVQPPTPSWGNMLGESMTYLGTAWWIGVFPGFALMLLIVAVQTGLNSFKRIWEH